MGNEINEERQFSENIERLLGGEDVKAGQDVSEDYRTAVDFSKKLIKSRVDPSPSFKTRLKERLLLKLAKQGAAARQKERVNWFWEGLKNLVPQNAAWRTATVTVVLMLVAVGVLWGSGILDQSTPTTVTGILPEEGPAPSMGIDDGGEMDGRGGGELGTPPQGAVTKTIELNQTQTAGGLSITLELVELSAEWIVFSAFVIPPDYSPPQDYPAVAEYTINGITKYAGYAEGTLLGNGIRLTWGYPQSYLDPVPSDATEIVFTIISFGDWQGPWEFIISLQDQS